MLGFTQFAIPAPVHGYYQFTVQKESNNNQAMFRVHKGGVQVLFNHAKGGTYATPVFASSFILQLQAGESVTIINDASTVIYGTISAEPSVYRSWFSGFLLYGL